MLISCQFTDSKITADHRSSVVKATPLYLYCSWSGKVSSGHLPGQPSQSRLATLWRYAICLDHLTVQQSCIRSMTDWPSPVSSTSQITTHFNQPSSSYILIEPLNNLVRRWSFLELWSGTLQMFNIFVWYYLLIFILVVSCCPLLFILQCIDTFEWVMWRASVL